MSNLAFVFPGQGSQKIGMLAELAEQNPIIETTFNEASEGLGYDMWQLIQQGTQEDINLTQRTQPILLTCSVAIWRLWNQKQGASPSQMAGHSLGEWSALVCANVIDFADGLKIVEARGKYMQQAVPVGQGAMAAIIGLDDQAILEACNEASVLGVVDAVNFNAPGQVVIAGSNEAVERAMEICKVAGAKRALPLPVSAPFHTSLMKPAVDNLADMVNAVTFRSPEVPIMHNVHAQNEQDPQAIKALMIEQIYSPVKWVDCVRQLKQSGVSTLVECGPGKVLSGLVKRIDRELTAVATESAADFDAALSL
ncbi:MAG: Malonyl CoA-acyl carrier protein transacylase [Cellvibrionales bacterium UBA7375]|nr:MAG: Malonyl CoA-acyl carrier protein transacylase [Cellvibrionales bacterium UBA7375]